MKRYTALPFSGSELKPARWSVAKLSAYLRSQKIELSPAQLGRILARNGISLKRTRSWKQSPEPEYAQKAERVLAF